MIHLHEVLLVDFHTEKLLDLYFCSYIFSLNPACPIQKIQETCHNVFSLSQTLELAENSSRKILKWLDRLSVLIGVAKAVHFLHTGVIPSSFSNRLKTSNILLDEHNMAKLSDFGMSILMEESEKVGTLIFCVKGENSKFRIAGNFSC